MNGEQFTERLYECSTQKELKQLKKSIAVEIDALNGKNCSIEPKMAKYIKGNFDKVITVIFVEPNEEFTGKMAQKMMFKRANGLEKHLKVPMGTFFHTWNGLKLKRFESYKNTVDDHIEMMKEMGNKQYKEQIAKFQEKEKQISDIAW